MLKYLKSLCLLTFIVILLGACGAYFNEENENDNSVASTLIPNPLDEEEEEVSSEEELLVDIDTETSTGLEVISKALTDSSRVVLINSETQKVVFKVEFELESEVTSLFFQGSIDTVEGKAFGGLYKELTAEPSDTLLARERAVSPSEEGRWSSTATEDELRDFQVFNSEGALSTQFQFDIIVPLEEGASIKGNVQWHK